ncbi:MULTISPECIES: signal peptidase II [Acinetobacter]|jgi:signal peptidase II|uniref:Lipoprotein signal peptidase n=1 Tax=Acinetobacter tjernbergiae DSM 14971 = CIP 107465 TaxID=1120928 RepID=V2UFY0_9GAMM|nr:MULTISPECIES: signal peptidase II [Acinetobacter]APR71261.1 signal peptidase II [Acinetobacter haemolyticus]ESK53698.1 signal peptidase II [Acinetobacter tjernbergiae DSM 14971 = CIP 107465]MCL5769384.1 signal peptidase II [Acinetobacter sp. ANC5681]
MPNTLQINSTKKMFQFYPRNLFWLGLSVLAIVLDQWTKWIALEKIPHIDLPCQDSVEKICAYSDSIQVIPQILDWTLAYNHGAAFSFLSDAGGWQRYLLTGLAGIFSLIFIFWLMRIPKKLVILPIAISLILGGAIGNLINRMVLGYVVDFIHIYYEKTWSFPVFNLADCSITLGVIFLLIDTFFLEKKRTQSMSNKHVYYFD